MRQVTATEELGLGSLVVVRVSVQVRVRVWVRLMPMVGAKMK